MIVQTTITKKWQMTIPLAARQALSLSKPGKVFLEIEKKDKKMKIKKPVSFLDLAGTFKPKKPVDAVKIRDLMENSYERA